MKCIITVVICEVFRFSKKKIYFFFFLTKAKRLQHPIPMFLSHIITYIFYRIILSKFVYCS